MCVLTCSGLYLLDFHGHIHRPVVVELMIIMIMKIKIKNDNDDVMMMKIRIKIIMMMTLIRKVIIEIMIIRFNKKSLLAYNQQTLCKVWPCTQTDLK